MARSRKCNKRPARRWKSLLYSPRLSQDAYESSGVPPIVADLLYYMHQAYYAYKPSVKPDNWDATNPMPPPHKGDLSVEGPDDFKMPATPVIVGLSSWYTGYNKYTGNIDMDYTLNNNAEWLANAGAHQLFHAIENQIYNIVQMSVLASNKEWWLESTCEYAATKLARKGRFIPEIKAQEWMGSGLYSNSNEMNKRTCYFLDYLTQ